MYFSSYKPFTVSGFLTRYITNWGFFPRKLRRSDNCLLLLYNKFSMTDSIASVAVLVRNCVYEGEIIIKE